jgi:hypothetical protein
MRRSATTVTQPHIFDQLSICFSKLATHA